MGVDAITLFVRLKLYTGVEKNSKILNECERNEIILMEKLALCLTANPSVREVHFGLATPQEAASDNDF